MTAIVLRGDARQLPLPDACVDLIVTSPPYFGLRSYTDTVKCYQCMLMEDNGRDPRQAWPDYARHVREVHVQHYNNQIGSEPTPAEYLEALWACTAEWVRVLKPGGSMFINLGDKYSTGNSGQSGLAELGKRWAGGGHSDGKGKRRQLPVPGMPPKSLLGIPWRYAIGCTDRLGLILRAEVIWQKPNGLPESVTDRVRRAHEQVFHFTRQPRYYAAVDEIREPHTYPGDERYKRNGTTYGRDMTGHVNGPLNPLGKLPGSVWSIPSAPLTVPARLGVDHFAAFPPALVRPLVLGWSPPGVCTACGEGRRPVVDRNFISLRGYITGKPRNHTSDRPDDRAGFNGDGLMGNTVATITGYACACGEEAAPGGWRQHGNCNPAHTPRPVARQRGAAATIPPGSTSLPPTRPAVVLDPFGGTGTTALVATTHGRVGVTVDRSADYCRLAAWRCSDPGERARARDMPKPPPIPDGMEPLFTM